MSKIVDGILTLLGSVAREDIEALPPVKREHFAAQLRFWADQAGKPDEPKEAGVLKALKDGERD